MDFFTKQKSALWLIVVLIIMNLIILTLLLLPRGFPRPPMRRAPDPKDRASIEEFNLTPDQKSQFWQYRDKYFEVIKEYTDKINNKKYELMQMLFQKEPDSQKLNTLADELGGLYAEFEKARFEQILRFKTILTDVQFNVFKNIVNEAYKPKPGEMDRGGPPPEFDAPYGPPPPTGDKHRPGEPPPPPQR
jgi:Spy/CpxP family protein refolding chaperone